MREADISSSFELRLGQPSQQTQAAGTSFSSMATSSVEHSKSHSFDQVMSKGCCAASFVVLHDEFHESQRSGITNSSPLASVSGTAGNASFHYEPT